MTQIVETNNGIEDMVHIDDFKKMIKQLLKEDQREGKEYQHLLGVILK